MSVSYLEKLTCKKVLAFNSAISLLSHGLPLIIAFFTIPLVIHGMGTERFGILTLIWVIIGASSILDFGLGHALTQFISKRLGAEDIVDIEIHIWTALFIIFILGIIACIAVFLLIPTITTLLMNVPDAYMAETQNSLYLLALSLPLLMLNISLVGILESFQKFGVIGILKIPIIFCNYIGPLLVLPFTKNLAAVVAVLVLGRFLSSMAYFIFCYKIISKFSGRIQIKLSHIKPLLGFGGWITLSNIINTIMSNIDRFFIAGLISTAVVAYYTTPLEILARISIIPAAIMSVMFPAMSAEFTKNRTRSRELFFQSMKTIFTLMFPIVLILIFFAKPGLSLWISAEFAEKSYKLAQIMSIGGLLFGLNIIYYNFIQATGRSDIPAKLHMIEFPLYLALLWFLTMNFGLIGAALAWLSRIIVDFFVLGFISLRMLKS
ncbi:MAG: hypothetical protein A2Y25_11435 [Candidatus Melainabacteria bacterium GWF2_37_15]|nr:MAG: hypothetical protein A2Y25_11435 [Candidatus Melainabacteria bacterium GWF2_37_15]